MSESAFGIDHGDISKRLKGCKFCKPGKKCKDHDLSKALPGVGKLTALGSKLGAGSSSLGSKIGGISRGMKPGGLKTGMMGTGGSFQAAGRFMAARPLATGATAAGLGGAAVGGAAYEAKKPKQPGA